MAKSILDLPSGSPALGDWVYVLKSPTGTYQDVYSSLNGILGLFQTNIALNTSRITTGTFANARISQSSVTQHQAALTIQASQIEGTIPGSGEIDPDRITSIGVTQHEADLAILSSQISGVIPNAQISEASVTQHQEALTLSVSQLSDYTESGATVEAAEPTEAPSAKGLLRLSESNSAIRFSVGTSTTADWAKIYTEDDLVTIDDLTSTTAVSATGKILLRQNGTEIARNFDQALIDRAVPVIGATGGSVAATEDHEYIEMTVGGTTYKVLTAGVVSAGGGGSVSYEGTTAAQGSSSSQTLAYPAGHQAGDRALIVMTTRGNETLPDPIITGWTVEANHTGSATSSYNRIIVLSQTVAGSSQGDVTIPDTGQYTQVAMMLLRGVTTLTVINSGSTGLTDAVSIGGGNVGTDALVMDFVAAVIDSEDDQISAFTNGDLSSLTMRIAENSSYNNGFGVYVATGEASGVVGATTATLNTSGIWNGVKIAAT